MNQMMIMQQSMFAARRRYAMQQASAMQQQAIQSRQQAAAQILGGTNPALANQNGNIVPAKRDRESDSKTEGSKKQKS